MKNVWMDTPVAMILAILAATGISAIVYGVYYFWVTKTGNKRHIQETEAIVVVAISFFVGVAISMFLVNNLIDFSSLSC